MSVTSGNSRYGTPQSTPPGSPRGSEAADPFVENNVVRAARQAINYDLTAIPSEPFKQEPIHGIASMVQQTHPHTYRYTSQVPWGGKRYLFTLEIPVGKPVAKITADEKINLDKSVEQFRDAFLDNLKKHTSSVIKPGADFSVIFTENGYTAFIPDPTRPFDIDSGYMKSPIQRTDDAAKELSEIVHSDTDGTGRVIAEKLTKSTLLKKAEVPANVAPDAPIAIHHPEGKNTCYAAAATWYMPEKIDELNQAIERHSEKNKALLEAFKKHLEEAEKCKKSGAPLEIEPFAKALSEYDAKLFPKDKMADAGEVVKILNGLIYGKETKLKYLSIQSPKEGETFAGKVGEFIAHEKRAPNVEVIPFDSAKHTQLDIGAAKDAFKEIPAVLELGGAKYRFTKAIKHAANHYTALVRTEKGEFYLCNDMAKNKKLADEKEFLNEAKGAVRFLYVKEGEAVPEQETIAEPELATRLAEEQKPVGVESKNPVLTEHGKATKLETGIRGGVFTFEVTPDKKPESPIVTSPPFPEVFTKINDSNTEYVFDFRPGQGALSKEGNREFFSYNGTKDNVAQFFKELEKIEFNKRANIRILLDQNHFGIEAHTLQATHAVRVINSREIPSTPSAPKNIGWWESFVDLLPSFGV